MENKKGQVSGGAVGVIILMAVMIIVSLAFIPSIFSSQATLTQTQNSGNVTFTLPANAASSQLTMCGQKAVSIAVTNITDGVTVPATNYTTSSVVSTTQGVLVAQITTTASSYASLPVNVSCNFEPMGYIEDTGGRAIAGIIGLFSVLAILAGCVFYWAKNNGWLTGV